MASETRPAAGQRMGCSVTPHPQITNGTEWRPLYCGVDSLYIGFDIEWEGWAIVKQELDRGKAAAIGDMHSESVLRLGISDQISLRAGKEPQYRFGLISPNYRMFIGRTREATTYPNVYVEPHAEALARLGAKGAVNKAREDVWVMGGVPKRIKPSRVDLCGDFLVPGGFSETALKAQRVGRATSVRTYCREEELETLYVGGGDVQLRLYNKSREIEQKSGKTWMWNLWDIEKTDHIWRVEFQLRRDALKRHGIITMDDLYNRIGSLWQYLTRKWVSFRLHDDSNTSRRTVAPFWQDVAKLADRFPGTLALGRPDVAAPPDMNRTIKQILGHVKSYAAMKGVEDWDRAVAHLLVDARQYVDVEDAEADIRNRRIRFGRTTAEHLGERRPDDTDEDFKRYYSRLRRPGDRRRRWLRQHREPAPGCGDYQI